jgi:two-component system phosphate regulon response regulator PhoB
VPVLVIVPEAPLEDQILRALKEAGIDALAAPEPARTVEAVTSLGPEAVILDMVLAGRSGFAICRELRESAATAGVPVLMLTSSSAEMDRILAFESGADDVLRQPFYPRELALRVKALMRRTGAGLRAIEDPETALEHGSLAIDLTRQRAYAQGEEVRLTDKELAILALLLRRPGRVFSRREILDHVWGGGAERTPRVVDTHMKGIRRKLGAAGSRIESLRGVGYRLSDAADDDGLPPPR